MHTLEKNIVNLYGTAGETWLDHLERTVKQLQDCWQLTDLVPLTNLSYHYVAKAIDGDGEAVVLKIGYDKQVISQEANALRYFGGQGSIALLDQHPLYPALLLAQAVPGAPLKTLYPKQIDVVMQAYVNVVSILHDRRLPENPSFYSINDWLAALDKVSTTAIPKPLLSRAIQLKNHLLATMKNPVLLHGDLHLDNILLGARSWLCIDPKGVIGEAEFEMAAFDFVDKNSPELMLERIEKLATLANLSPERLRDWTFVRLILSAVWSLEDRGDLSTALSLAQVFQN